MQISQDLQLSEFQKALTPQRIRAFRIISIALFLGATFFMAVILYMYSATPPATEKDMDMSLLSILSAVHIVEAMICYLAAFFVYRFFQA